MTVTRRINVTYTSTTQDRCKSCREAHYEILDLYLPCPNLVKYPGRVKDEALTLPSHGARHGITSRRISTRSNAFDLETLTVQNTQRNASPHEVIHREPYWKFPPTFKGFLQSQMLSKSEREAIRESRRRERGSGQVGTTIQDFFPTQILARTERQEAGPQDIYWQPKNISVSYDETSTIISQKRHCI